LPSFIDRGAPLRYTLLTLATADFQMQAAKLHSQTAGSAD